MPTGRSARYLARAKEFREVAARVNARTDRDALLAAAEALELLATWTPEETRGKDRAEAQRL
jgi:hypothetical protein